jgi:alkylhydroperoxidase/carboxymuconolactone decarboxylase family protein YurZ
MTTMTAEPTPMPVQPTVQQVLAGMSAQVGGHLPRMVELAATVMPEMVLRHAQDGGFAMPREGGALPEETRTLILLGIALATGSHCVEGLMHKAKVLDIDNAKILETVKIARFAEATRVFNNAEHVLAQLEAGH